MNAEILNYPENLEDLIIKDSKIYYPLMTLSKSDLERFIRKCLRDENFSILYKYNVVCKINSTITAFNELKLLHFNLTRSYIHTSFILSEKIKGNEKIESSVLSYLKKINSVINEIKDADTNSKDFFELYPQVCTIDYLQSQNLFEWFYLISLKEYNNISNSIKHLSEFIFEKLSEKYPYIYNQLTYKLFLRIKGGLGVRT